MSGSVSPDAVSFQIQQEIIKGSVHVSFGAFLFISLLEAVISLYNKQFSLDVIKIRNETLVLIFYHSWFTVTPLKPEKKSA